MGSSFKDKVALVTGGSDGIGFATARMLARRGAKVTICARRAEKLDEARAMVEAEGLSIETAQIDVSDEAAFGALVDSVVGRHGRIDMLVNNAMSVSYAAIQDLTLDEWRRDFAVNADAVFIGTRAAMRHMMEAGGGAIVNIASTCGLRAAPGLSSYSASKAALIQFSAVAAMEGARAGVRVNVVVPGAVSTPATQSYVDANPAAAQATQDAIPMGRNGRPDELAEAIAFLLSDAASYITGVALPVDGGKASQLYLPG